jgi:hypothetical protein
MVALYAAASEKLLQMSLPDSSNREGVAQRVAHDALADASSSRVGGYLALHRALVRVMAAALAGNAVGPGPRRLQRAARRDRIAQSPRPNTLRARRYNRETAQSQRLQEFRT